MRALALGLALVLTAGLETLCFGQGGFSYSSDTIEDVKRLDALARNLSKDVQTAKEKRAEMVGELDLINRRLDKISMAVNRIIQSMDIKMPPLEVQGDKKAKKRGGNPFGNQ